MEFARTGLAYRFFAETLPGLVRALGRLADAVGRLADALERRGDSSTPRAQTGPLAPEETP
ncbi:MAG: hypothetical protein MUF34_36115 [Polyangiaceae bacterium]|jgi:hypothetical protein|nr:hypothetical protein [Polyangiaceae bacterium]